MGTVVLAGATSGSTTLSPTDAVTTVITLPASTDTLVGKATTDTLTNKTLTSPTISGTPVMSASVLTSATAQASTSGTSIDFTGIPSWVKRITVMMNGVSTNGTSIKIVQIGSGSISTSGYISAASASNTLTGVNSTAGLLLSLSASAADTIGGVMTICTLGSNLWTMASSTTFATAATITGTSSGNITLGGTLDRVRITTVNGTDTFDAGSINIMYE